MKKIIILGLMPFLAFANEINEEHIKILKNLGLPTPDQRIEVISSDNTTGSLKMIYDEKLLEMKKNGYVNTTSDRAMEILNIKKSLKKQFVSRPSVMKKNNSEIRKNHNEIAFAYSYLGTPSSEIIEHYGYAPIGAYKETGWTGGVEFYKTSFANCSYMENNMLAANGAVRIYENEATKDINGKYTFIEIEGNESSGFLYRVQWFDDIFNRDLECATREYSVETRNNVINLAKKIDNI